MKMYGIIGFPLTHSFSKKYFTDKIEKEGIIESVFDLFPLNTIEEFPTLLSKHPSLKGLAVTIPYKEQVLKYISNLSEEVKQIGAANCIRIKGDELMAFNTDIIGFERSFVKHLKPQQTKALVLGTGGASKAVQHVLKNIGIEFLVVSRNAAENSIRYADITETVIKDHKIIINSTPLGMSPSENSCPDIPYHFLTVDHYLYDLVYAPAKTLFLQNGEAHGATIENGFEMLIIQAEENWRIWNEE